MICNELAAARISVLVEYYLRFLFCIRHSSFKIEELTVVLLAKIY